MSSGLYQIRDKNLDTTLDLTRLKPYGDTMNDGKVQTSFTLPVKDDDKGAAAAVMLAQKMGLADPNVALRQKLDENFTFYVVYGSLTHSINYNEIVVQTVTQKDVHIQNLTELIELAEAEGVRDKYIFCCGGARITHALAKELGYDAGFGAGTYADDVATFCSKELVRRLGK